MESEEEAQVAIAALDGYGVKGSHIHVEVSDVGNKKNFIQQQLKKPIFLIWSSFSLEWF